jgi:hypothetical protein
MDQNAVVELGARQVEASLRVTLDPPAFGLLNRWQDLQALAFSHLSRFGLRIEDIKNETTSPNPADACVACWLQSHRVVVKYRLDRVELLSNAVPRADGAPTTGIVDEALQVLRVLCPEVQVAATSISVAIHGLAEGGADARLRPYLAIRHDGEAAIEVSGISLSRRYGPRGSKGVVVLERSVLIDGGVFLRVTTDFDGTVPAPEAIPEAIKFFQESASLFGLEVVWEL